MSTAPPGKLNSTPPTTTCSCGDNVTNPSGASPAPVLSRVGASTRGPRGMRFNLTGSRRGLSAEIEPAEFRERSGTRGLEEPGIGFPITSQSARDPALYVTAKSHADTLVRAAWVFRNR